MKKTYKEIKKILLEDENFFDCRIRASEKKITLCPIQNKDFFYIGEPLEKYLFEDENDKTRFRIGGRFFKLYEYSHFNTTIFKLIIKEV